MNVTVNGTSRAVPEGTTLGELLEGEQVPLRGSAAAVDGVVVPRGSWPTAQLREGSAVEVITAVQGG
jgi:sulfur carrier protein